MAQLPEKIFWVSSAWKDKPQDHEFSTIQAAINVVPAWGKYKIVLCSDMLGVPELRLLNDNVQIQIDGQNSYGITFVSGRPIVRMESGKALKFIDCTFIRGEEIIIRLDGSNVGFYRCQSVMAQIDLVDGKYSNLYVHDTKLYGANGQPPINIYNDKPSVGIKRSFIKGGLNSPAIYFRGESDRRVKISDSVLLHYDGTEHSPIIKSGTFTVGVYAYNCSSSDRLCNIDIINYVNSNNNNIPDPEITF